MLSVAARVELFKKQFPKIKVTAVQERQGTDHEVIEINHTWMCKSAKTQDGISSLEREYRVLQALKGKIDVAIPVPVHYEENFLVYEKIPGSPLIPYTFHKLGQKQKSNLVFAVGVFLMQLHKALSAEQIHDLHLPVSDWPWSFEKLQEHRHYFQDNQNLLDLFDQIMGMYQTEMQDQFEATLIHNDMSMHNIIINPFTGQLHGVIDFSDVAFGDPVLDLRMRYNNSFDYARSVAFVYSVLNQQQTVSSKVYGYYFATEFSRYFDYRNQNNDEMAQKTLQALIRFSQDFFAHHDNCAEDKCQHVGDKIQQPTA